MARMRLNTDGTLTPIGQRARTHPAKRDTPNRRLRNTRAHRAWAHAVINRDGMCMHCGATNNLTADHITPLAHGGAPYDTANGQALCATCNSRKGATRPDAGGRA